MSFLESLPAANAILNGMSASLILLGYFFIKRGNKSTHRLCMILALSCSILFICSYLTYHYSAGVTRFAGPDWARYLYFTILFSHTPLAALVFPMIIVTVVRAAKGRFAAHKKLARWTFPIWLYVSITGILIYFMLYQWFPSRTAG